MCWHCSHLCLSMRGSDRVLDVVADSPMLSGWTVSGPYTAVQGRKQGGLWLINIASCSSNHAACSGRASEARPAADGAVLIQVGSEQGDLQCFGVIIVLGLTVDLIRSDQAPSISPFCTCTACQCKILSAIALVLQPFSNTAYLAKALGLMLQGLLALARRWTCRPQQIDVV